MLNVFASWCEPCQSEAPLLRGRSSMLAGQTARRCSASPTSTTRAASEQFAQRYHITYPVLRDVNGNFVRAFGTTGVPETFVINRQGRIQALQRYPVTSQWFQRTLPRFWPSGRELVPPPGCAGAPPS